MQDGQPKTQAWMSESEIALLVLVQTPAIVAYVDRDLSYRFANSAYLEWFGKSRQEMQHMTMKEVLGPIFEKNLPYIRGALAGTQQVFEREVVLPSGAVRYGLMTYKPDQVEDYVRGFFVHVADVTPLKDAEFALKAAQREAEEVSKRELLHLKQTNSSLEHLASIGQEITAQLDASAITHALDQHIHRLISACYFGIFLFDEQLQCLIAAGDGDFLPQRIALQDEHSLTARCMRERAEIVINLNENEVEPGSMRSQIYAPLLVGERALGVMTIQAKQANAYAEREQLILRALSAYGAVALENARAYQRLQDAQMQLVAQAKMAALGSLVAGVAHELNTPLGNSLLIATTLEVMVERFYQQCNEQAVRRSDLNAFLENIKESTGLITRGLQTASHLVSSFKQVAADRTHEQRRCFNLQQTGRDIVATVQGRISSEGRQIFLDIPDSIEMDSYPGPLGQVLSNLINNALLHAFTERIGGNMLLAARLLSIDKVEIIFHDDGVGIAPNNLKRIFEPFFTTTMGRGSNGLGLNISYNIVTSILNGEISAASQLGVGTRFTLVLPVKA